jgi:hypothetical protein
VARPRQKVITAASAPISQPVVDQHGQRPVRSPHHGRVRPILRTCWRSLYLFNHSKCSTFWQETRRKFGQDFEQAQVRLVPGDQQAHQACGHHRHSPSTGHASRHHHPRRPQTRNGGLIHKAPLTPRGAKPDSFRKGELKFSIRPRLTPSPRQFRARVYSPCWRHPAQLQVSGST